MIFSLNTGSIIRN